ncbi:MAG TPA: bifunctional phosphopantothenoylcysteine decarboxylase/phosphopantothenate--cysteine ligase CoaBC [Acidiferrobacterales bacterium]|nr:bifunctional phosphopantothenoylcysteine decarboxylase/phosphopantothenate--cysteine ligase CoaBC [Acidiferrobacterales bacterium]
MATLVNKHILLGVTGGIAAYKSADLVRRLREAGAAVRVVMTDAACEFITELTLQAVSSHPVHRNLLDTQAEAAMGHIELARWADAILVAPASADFLARLAQGRGDDLLTTVCLASAAPLAVAPAMNQQMWRNPATQANVATLRQRGVQVFGPAEGAQACGDVGPGRMLEPTELATLTAGLFETGALDGLNVLITAGPTWEALDPVRGLTNKSSGKMGYAVAEAAAEAGAQVTLISGPVALAAPERITTLRVTSAQEMYDAVHERIGSAAIFIGVAAVADYRPANVAEQKIKKSAERLTIELVRNPDILASVAALKPAPFTVGFAAETEHLEAAARAKLAAKGVDLIAANLVGGSEGGFGADENRLLLVDRAGTTELPLASKAQLARTLIRHIAKLHQQDEQRRAS